MNKATAPLAIAFVLLCGGAAVAGESFTGYDEHGNQVHVVDGWVVGTTPRAASAPSAAVVQAAPTVRYGGRSRSLNRSTPLRGGIGHGPTGRLEYNPYDPRKWFRDERGMIDQINRDYPPVYPRRR